MDGPAISSPPYNELVERYGLTMLKQPGDLQLVNGDLALTKDGDLALGAAPYNSLFRLVEYWRHYTPHIQFLYGLVWQMKERENEANARLEDASSRRILARGPNNLFSPDFLAAWHSHYGEEGAAIAGHLMYAGCVMIISSNALMRFRNDIDASDEDWSSSSLQFSGFSSGQIILAAANGFRHEDEWAKTRKPNALQRRSRDVLHATLGPRDHLSAASPPGRCPEVLTLLSCGRKFDGFTASILSFAHEIALRAQTRMAAAG